jgi:hypothetical protein
MGAARKPCAFGGAAMKQKVVVSVAGVVVIFLLAVLAVNGILGQESRSSNPGAQPVSQVLQITGVPTEDLRMNRVLRHGSFTTLILSLRNYCGDVPVANPDPRKQWVQVELVIGNGNTEPLPLLLALKDVLLVTESDQAYPPTQRECPVTFGVPDLPANALTRGTLVFDIPAGETPKLLRYTLDGTDVVAGLRY